jgi:hypothetical protein
VLDRRGKVVTSAVTSLDIHDLARTARTYGVKAVYIVHPVQELREFASRIREHWFESSGREFDSRRREALELVQVIPALSDAVSSIERESGRRPLIVYTSASSRGGLTYDELRAKIFENKISENAQPILLLFGTGFGLAPEVISNCDVGLAPIYGADDYNHLPVRAAVAIILDRLLGR